MWQCEPFEPTLKTFVQEGRWGCSGPFHMENAMCRFSASWQFSVGSRQRIAEADDRATDLYAVDGRMMWRGHSIVVVFPLMAAIFRCRPVSRSRLQSWSPFRGRDGLSIGTDSTYKVAPERGQWRLEIGSKRPFERVWPHLQPRVFMLSLNYFRTRKPYKTLEMLKTLFVCVVRCDRSSLLPGII